MPSLACALSAFATSYGPPDQRSWDEVVQNFTAVRTDDGFGRRDGLRLKELDPKRAAAFLIPFLSKDHPLPIRVNTIDAVGEAAIQEAIPALSRIAQDPGEEEYMRAAALSRGLRWMHHPDAVRTAIALAADKSPKVRTAAYWVLREDGTDEAIAVLEKRLLAKDYLAAGPFIQTLLTGKRPLDEVVKIVFEICPGSELPADAVAPYVTIMESTRYAPAQETMLAILVHGSRAPQADLLRYFRSFPRNEVVPYLLKHIEQDQSWQELWLFYVASSFVASPDISAENKTKLKTAIARAQAKIRRLPNLKE